MNSKSKKFLSTLLAVMTVFGLLAAMPLTVSADDGPMEVTVNPVGANYVLNQTAVPLKATFYYSGGTEQPYANYPIKVQWYWSLTDTNTGRDNGQGEYVRDNWLTMPFEYQSTLTPTTDTGGVRYYYAVMEYMVYPHILTHVAEPELRYAVTEPARIEVIAPNATISPEFVTFEKGGSDDIALTVDTAGHLAQSIKNGDYTLQAGTDFVINNITSMTLKASYLNTLDEGTHTLTFNFSGGTSPTLIIAVTAANVAPAITGPTTMTLTQGYAATSTGAYIISGAPVPAVAKISGDAAFTWNNGTSKLDIAAGLPVGTYPVVLQAKSTAGTAALIFTLTVTPSSAASFPFTDVLPSHWSYADVRVAWEQGLINGKSDTLFAPEDNLTYAEAVKLAACMHQLYSLGEVTLTNGSPNWYDSYVAYAKDKWIIGRDYDWNAPATRAEYMDMFSKAMPLDEINTIADGAIPDVPMTHPQAYAIYKMYRAGIVQGVDGAHNCNPNANIKRSEVATILTRMMNEGVRIRFNM